MLHATLEAFWRSGALRREVDIPRIHSMARLENRLTDEQIGDIESLARESSESNGRLKHLAPDAVLRLADEVRVLRASLQSARVTFSLAKEDLDSEEAAVRRAASQRIREALEREMPPVVDDSWIERAVSALIDLGWLPPEGRDWAAGLLRRHVDGQR